MNKLVISFLLGLSIVAIGAIVPTHRVTEPMKAEQHQLVQQEIYKYINLLTPQNGFGHTSASGYDTIFLSQKYPSASGYVISLTPVGFENSIGIGFITDSSFQVFTIDFDGIGTENDFHWQAMGVIQ